MFMLENGKLTSLADQAQVAMKNPGGIDLTSDKALAVKMDSRLHGNDNRIQFNIDLAMLKRFNDVPGLSPIITSMESLLDLRGFLEH